MNPKQLYQASSCHIVIIYILKKLFAVSAFVSKKNSGIFANLALPTSSNCSARLTLKKEKVWLNLWN
jgi:hypothetical protein